MKKHLIFGVLLSLGAVSCRSQCPAYSLVRPAQHQATLVAAPATASAALATAQQ